MLRQNKSPDVWTSGPLFVFERKEREKREERVNLFCEYTIPQPPGEEVDNFLTLSEQIMNFNENFVNDRKDWKAAAGPSGGKPFSVLRSLRRRSPSAGQIVVQPFDWAEKQWYHLDERRGRGVRRCWRLGPCGLLSAAV